MHLRRAAMLLPFCLGCTLISMVSAQEEMYTYRPSRSVFGKRGKSRDIGHVMTLENVDEFYTVLQKHVHVVAMLCDGRTLSESAGCINVAPLFTFAGQRMENMHPPVNFIRIMAGYRQKEMEQRWGVTLPHLIFFRNGAPHYWPERNKGAVPGLPHEKMEAEYITKWVNEETIGHAFHIEDFKTELTALMQKKPQPFEEPEYNEKDDPMSKKTRKLHVEEITETFHITYRHECVVVGMFKNGSDVTKEYREMAGNKYEDMCIFGYTFNRMVPKRYAIKQPAVAVNYIGPSGRKVAAIYGGKVTDLASMQEFVRAYRYPLVWRMEGPERFRAFYSDGRPALMLFCDVSKCQDERAALKSAQMKLKRRLLGVQVDVEVNWAPILMNKVTVKKSDAPVLLIAEEMTRNTEATRVVKYSGDLINKHTIIDWAKDYLKDYDAQLAGTARNDL